MLIFPFCRIAELDVADENDINWDLLAEGWSSVRSPQWLRSKWWTIKRQIANHKDVSFPGEVLFAVNPPLLSAHLISRVRSCKLFASSKRRLQQIPLETYDTLLWGVALSS